MIYDGTGSLEVSTGWYLAVLGQYGAFNLHLEEAKTDMFIHKNIAKGTTDPRVEFCLPK